MRADIKRLQRIADLVFSSWNTQDVETVLACYTDDLIYVDPNTRGPIVGRDAMRSYLSKLFDRWTMTWAGGELFSLEGTDGSAILWTGTLTPVGDTRSVEIGGIDLGVLDGDLLCRNEVYFDRSPLAALLEAAPR